MEGALGIAEQKCRRYYDGYRTCIERFPETWHLDCTKEKDKFTKCAETHPLITSIRSQCEKEFKKYEQCGLKNRDSLQNCGEEYKDFEKCVSKVTAAIKSENNKQT
ncbi:hypothetical protein LOTGIDRAFT_203338 [Lottia gigantea]|uniref:Uncharacterized protein n=1 Tax=Lottia gigantea TaxID=225164 RepID=V4CRA9_LOTGI|nr:hypothetical protein LOTGIDRAFT_203338 [Lottia gigantea]ESP05025.1 hypothetical protein LOTGIDRAFT_203338 [Lottia gigantea]